MQKIYKTYLILVIAILSIQTSVFTQTTSKIIINGAGDKNLDYQEQTAYQDLLTTKIFTFALHGVAAADFRSTKSLANLLQEKEAEKALESLAKEANPEGQVYALIGLQVIKSESFKPLFENFKENLSEKRIDKISFGGGGCIFVHMSLKKDEVVKNMESGEYVKKFTKKFKGIKFQQVTGIK